MSTIDEVLNKGLGNHKIIFRTKPPSLSEYPFYYDRIVSTPVVKGKVFHISNCNRAYVNRLPRRPNAEKKKIAFQKKEEEEEEEKEDIDDLEWEPYLENPFEEEKVKKKKENVVFKAERKVEVVKYRNLKSVTEATFILQKYIVKWLAKKELLSLRKRAMKRQKVCEELLETEKIYINHLLVAEDVFVNPIRKMSKSKGSGVGSQDFNGIFGTGFTSLKGVNQTFYDSLYKCIYKDGVYQEKALVSVQILWIAPFFKMYRTYCANYKKAIEIWKKLKSIQQVAIAIGKMEKDTRTTKLGLISYLILPIQRIPRYRLLIRDLIKNTEEQHPDYQGLKFALNKISDVADFLDSSIKEMEASDELKTIQDKFIISKKFEIVSPHRKKVKEGEVRQGLQAKKMKVVYLYLFNDILLISYYAKNDMFYYKTHMSLLGAKIYCENDQHQTKFKIATPTYQTVFTCKSLKERNEWIRDVLNAINSLKKRRQFTEVRDLDHSASTIGYAIQTKVNMNDVECVEYIKDNKTPMLKYCTGMGAKPHIRHFIVDTIEKKMIWYSPKKNEAESSIRLMSVQELVSGQKTSAFKKNPKRDLEGLSFSLLYGVGHRTSGGEWTGKTLDLICETKEDFIIWTRALTFILQDKNETTAQRNREQHKKRIKEGQKMKQKFTLVGNDAFSWGKGEAGALGHGTLKDSFSPKVIKDFLYLDVMSFTCGEACAFVILNDGKLFAWGSGLQGKLGFGDEADYYKPTQVKSLSDYKIKQVSTGEFHTLILTEKGKVWACGKNENGAIGIGNFKKKKQLVPTNVKFRKNSKIVYIEAGTNHSSAIDSNGSFYTWGSNKDGQLGLGHTNDVSVPTFVKESEGRNFIQLAFGFCHSLALTKNGNVYCFGDGQDGQLGNGRSGKNVRSLKPEILESAFLKNKVKQISCGAFHCGAVTRQGKIYMWGGGMYGQIGNGKKKSAVKYPTLLTAWIKFPCKYLSCGTFHACAMLEDRSKDNVLKHRVISWGAGTYGRLGIKSEKDQLAPKEVRFFEGKEVKRINCGGCMSSAICTHAWVPDKDVKECMECTGKFTFRRRKHHCRNCGGIFCNNCSKKRMTLIKLGFLEPVRVCKNCHSIETTRQTHSKVK